MVNQQMLKGNWNEIRGKIKQKWGQLTDQELHQVEGRADELVGLIQRKTGEGREAIEAFLEDAATRTATHLEHATEVARDYATRASESVKHTSDRVTESLSEGYAQAEDLVRSRPAESLAMMFGLGIVTGIVVGLLVRSR